MNGAALGAVVRAPFTVRTARELLFCLTGVTAALCVIGALLAAPFGLSVPALAVRLAAGAGDNASPPVGGGLFVFVAWVVIGLAVAMALTPRVARGVGAVQRYLARGLLGRTIAGPPPVRRRLRGPVGWLVAGWRDGPGWRAVAYLLVRLPIAVLDGYAVFCWTFRLVAMTYPLWWRLFRNHPPQVRLDPVPVLTPVGSFRVATYPGTLAAFAVGAAMLLAAPWIARVAGAADLALMRVLLGPGRLAQRVRDLEETRARAVDDTARLLCRVERDLHDGAQVRLAALAMNLGRAKEKLGQGVEPDDLAAARELVDAAHRSAKDALAELRDLARGIHPPVLDNGLADALATLAAGSAVPVRLVADIPVRPTPAIETIAYFCAAELLANAAKHSHAGTVTVEASQHRGVLLPAAAGVRAMRVVIAEDAALMREGLVGLLEDRGHQVCAAVADAEGLLTAVAADHPDVVVVDIRMPPTHTDEGLRAALELRRDHPGIGVLVLSQYIETRYAAQLLAGHAAGVGYLLKDRVADVADFVDALTRVATGGTALDPEVVSQLLGAYRRADRLAELTPRERDVLALMAEGRSNAGIATALTVTGGVVEKHVASIFAKLGLPPAEGDNRRVLAVLRYLGAPYP